MSAGYFILLPDGSREGPYAEEELLDLMDAGEIAPGTRCVDAASGRVSEAGSLFRVLAPVTDVPRPVEWKPVPFPGEETNGGKTAGRSVRKRVRLLYHGHPCVITYWRSALFAAALVAGGDLAKTKWPGMLAVGLLSGMLVLLFAVLHRMSRRFVITSERVEWHCGLLFRRSRELGIADIQSMEVTGNGIGRITFVAAAGPHENVIFDRVWRASALKTLVWRVKDAAPEG